MADPLDRAADLDLARRAAREAGEVLLRYFGRATRVDYKAPDQPVTRADLEADALLRHRLLGARPKYGWLSEETADSPDRLARERVWIVDPLDGTRSFIDRFPEYTVSVALAIGGEAVLGVVLNPSTGELYHAERGSGAYLDGAALRIGAQASRHPVLLASRSEIRRGDFEALRDRWRIRPLGSTTYKLVKVADGSGDAYLSRGPKSEWDVAAAALIVEEAGGRVTDASGEAIRYNRPAPFLRGVVASRADLHAKLLEELRSLPRRTMAGTDST